MELKMLKAKDVRFGIKRGMTEEDFCNKYQCTEDELLNQLHKVFHRSLTEAENCYGQMKTNRKRKKASKTESILKKPVVPTVSEVLAGPPLPVIAVVEVEPFINKELELLEARVERLSSEIAETKEQYSTAIQQGRRYLDRLREASSRIDAAKVMLECRYSDYKTILLEYGMKVQEIDKLHGACQKKIAEFDEACEKIRELKKTTIYAYSDGSIVGEDNNPIPDAPEGANLWKELLETPECENLRVKDIRLLARVLGIVKSNAGAIEVSFEDDALDEVYQQLLSVVA